MSGTDSYAARLVAVVRELRRGPVTAPQIAEHTGIPRKTVHRILDDLAALGVPIVREQLELEGPGRPPTGLRLTVAGLREWLG